VPVLRPLISANNTINVEPGQQLAGDHRLRRQPAAAWREIIAAMDVGQRHRRRGASRSSTPSPPTWRRWCLRLIDSRRGTGSRRGQAGAAYSDHPCWRSRAATR